MLMDLMYLADYTVMCVLEEFKNDAVLSSTDRVLKTLAQNNAKEQIKVHSSDAKS